MNVHDQMRAKLQAKLEVAQRQVKSLKALLLVVDELEALGIESAPAFPFGARPKRLRRRKRPPAPAPATPPPPVEPVPCAGEPTPTAPSVPEPVVPQPEPQP
jgi:hypothetical protein